MAFSAEESKLVSNFVQTLLYGIFFVLYFLSVWVLTTDTAHRGSINRQMLVIATTMFVFATMHIGVNFTRIIYAFVRYKDAPGGPGAFFSILDNFTNLFGSTLYIAQTLVGDGIVLYRCYLVWARSLWVVAFPILLLTGSTVTGIGILYSFAHIEDGAGIFAHQLRRWIASFFTLTLVTNLLCTALVAFRIWRLNRAAARLPGMTDLKPLLIVIIESGAIYSATLITLLGTFLARSWVQYLLVDAVSPIVGIVFSMVILRIGLGLSSTDGTPLRRLRGDLMTTTATGGHLTFTHGAPATAEATTREGKEGKSREDESDQGADEARYSAKLLPISMDGNRKADLESRLESTIVSSMHGSSPKVDSL